MEKLQAKLVAWSSERQWNLAYNWTRKSGSVEAKLRPSCGRESEWLCVCVKLLKLLFLLWQRLARCQSWTRVHVRTCVVLECTFTYTCVQFLARKCGFDRAIRDDCLFYLIRGVAQQELSWLLRLFRAGSAICDKATQKRGKREREREEAALLIHALISKPRAISC